MRTLARALAGALAVLLVAGCSPTTGPSGDVAATVGDATISRDVLASAVRELAGEQVAADAEARAQQIGASQRQVLGLLIQARIIEGLADERGVTVDPAEADRIVEEQTEAAGGEEALATALAAGDLTFGLFVDVLVPTQQRVDGIVAQLAEGEQTRTVRHILVETEDEADDIIEQLDEGADFGELAQEHSVDTGSAQRGGDLGPAPRETYTEAFDDAVWAADLDTVVGPIGTGFGFHVLEVTDEGEIDVDALTTQELNQLFGERRDEMLADAFQAAEVEVAAGLGVWSPEQLQVLPPERVGEGAPQDGPMAELEDLVEP